MRGREGRREGGREGGSALVKALQDDDVLSSVVMRVFQYKDECLWGVFQTDYHPSLPSRTHDTPPLQPFEYQYEVAEKQCRKKEARKNSVVIQRFAFFYFVVNWHYIVFQRCS